MKPTVIEVNNDYIFEVWKHRNTYYNQEYKRKIKKIHWAWMQDPKPGLLAIMLTKISNEWKDNQ